MDQLKGFMIQGKEGKVCYLKKVIYSLKQVGQQWHIHLNDTLEGGRFQKLISGNASIFIKHHDWGDPLIALVYGDDITLQHPRCNPGSQTHNCHVLQGD